MSPASAPPDDGRPVGSPCIDVCRIDPASGYCEGCLRTLAEIGAWSTLDDAGRRRVWLDLAGRRIGGLPAPGSR